MIDTTQNSRNVYVRLDEAGEPAGVFEMPAEYNMETAKTLAQEIGHRILGALEYEAEQNGAVKVRVSGGQMVLERLKEAV